MAFDYVLARSPRVLGIGEAHAPRGMESIASATRRFSDTLVPRLKGRASDLLIELWVATGDCGKVERKVARQQEPVSQGQASGNQGEFVALGHRAKAFGIRPHALVPSCDEYREIANAGASDIDRMLQMVADATTRDLERLLARAPSSQRPELVIAYGGALHNDLLPRPGREHWSFGPAIHRRTGGHYVELDLIVPEFIQDTETWRSQSWFAAYRASGPSLSVRLYEPAENSFVLIFASASDPPGKSGSASCPCQSAPPAIAGAPLR